MALFCTTVLVDYIQWPSCVYQRASRRIRESIIQVRPARPILAHPGTLHDYLNHCIAGHAHW